MLNCYGTGNSSAGCCCQFVDICQLSNNDRAKLSLSMCTVPAFNIHHLFNCTAVVSSRETRSNQISSSPGPGKAGTVKPLRSGAFLSGRWEKKKKRGRQRCHSSKKMFTNISKSFQRIQDENMGSSYHVNASLAATLPQRVILFHCEL